jgi:hypothetical protein
MPPGFATSDPIPSMSTLLQLQLAELMRTVEANQRRLVETNMLVDALRKQVEGIRAARKS